MTEKIEGYRELEEWEVSLINVVKEMETECLAVIDAQFSVGGCNDRWLSIARTDLQKGFMAFVRAIAKPEGDDPNELNPKREPCTAPDHKMRTAEPIVWKETEAQEPLLGKAIRDAGLTGEDEGLY